MQIIGATTVSFHVYSCRPNTFIGRKSLTTIMTQSFKSQVLLLDGKHYEKYVRSRKHDNFPNLSHDIQFEAEASYFWKTATLSTWSKLDKTSIRWGNLMDKSCLWVFFPSTLLRFSFPSIPLIMDVAFRKDPVSTCHRIWRAPRHTKLGQDRWPIEKVQAWLDDSKSPENPRVLFLS